jgi:hypothetical protein
MVAKPWLERLVSGQIDSPMTRITGRSVIETVFILKPHAPKRSIIFLS